MAGLEHSHHASAAGIISEMLDRFERSLIYTPADGAWDSAAAAGVVYLLHAFKQFACCARP
jgi:hypothetical protein